MHFFSLHLLRENDTVKSLQMALALTKERYITFQVELSTLNSTRFDSVYMFFGLIRLGSVRLSRNEPNRIVEYSVRFRPLICNPLRP